ncbi:MAG: hypothetical protein HXS46_09110 [Theionarchaea archaeon]|nr:hypothetical protein [Theionarchaea archaeon]
MRKTQTNHRKVVYSLSLVALLLISGITTASEQPTESLPALVIVDSDELDLDTVAESIRGMNGTVSHLFPPQVIIGTLSIEAEDYLRENAEITVYRGPVDVTECEDWRKETLYAAIAWNNNYMGLSVDAGLNEPPISPEPPPDDAELLGDVKPYVGSVQYPESPYGAGFLDTSEYLVGSVAVGVIFLESNGMIDEDTENWTAEEEANVTSEIQNGLNWLLQQEPSANLSFVYEWHYQVPVGYEPIKRPHTDDDLWEQHAMHYLGYTDPNYLVNEYTFVNDLRQAYQTDWAFIIFVVDNSEDEDNSFSDGHYAYSFLGGPRMILTYSNSIWGIANMDSLVAHQTCHIFWALDQHCTSQVERTAVSGYLAGENTNSEWDGESCSSTAPCIMKGEPMYNTQVEESTRKQIGWLDSDYDGILDVLDTVPDITVNQANGIYSGTAAISPLPNENPFKEGNPVSLNTIVAVQFRVDENEWQEAEPVDGSFDEPEEGFTFTFAIEMSGEYTVEVKAQNSAGNWSEPATITVCVGDPHLQSEITISPEKVNPQDTVLVAMTVHNTGDAAATEVIPVLTAPDTVEKVSGPAPESADIPAGESAAFEWVYRVIAQEESGLAFSGNATGHAETGEDISSLETTSNTIQVVVEPLRNSDMTALLYGIIEGDSVTLFMEVHNAGEVTLENVTPSEITVTCTGTASVSLLKGPLPQTLLTLQPGDTKIFEWKYAAAPGAQGGTAHFAGNVSGEAEEEVVTSDTVKATVGIKSPAILTSFIVATPREVAVGETITVAMTVQNLGQAEAVEVMPSELSVSGTGEVTLESGPSRTSVQVEGRSFQIIHWTYTAVKEGTVTFSGSAQGIDASTGGPLSVPADQSNEVTIKPGPEDTDTDTEDTDTDTEDTDTEDTDTEDTDTEDTDTEDTDTEDTEPITPSVSDSQCERAQRTIKKVRELLEKARNLLEEKQTQRRDVRICRRLFAEAQMYFGQAETFLENGKCNDALNSAIAALKKVYELLSCLEHI